MKKIILLSFLLFGISTNYSQNITNTLGSGGVFIIKDGSTTFFTLNQSDGGITLPITTSALHGVIFKGPNRFIHDYSPSGLPGLNTFIGTNSGNFTMTGTGTQASFNTAVGHSSLTSLTTGNSNSAFGFNSLFLTQPDL